MPDVTLQVRNQASTRFTAVVTVANMEDHLDHVSVSAALEGLPAHCHEGPSRGAAPRALPALGIISIKLDGTIDCDPALVEAGEYKFTVLATVTHEGPGIERDLTNNTAKAMATLTVTD
jgi:hypothetical protein